MAEIFVSPGVYVRERDFSYYISSIGDSALALVGETKKGPAGRPTLIKNMSSFREIFGNLDPDKQVGYAARSYFKYANQAYIVRVLGGDTLRPVGAKMIHIYSSAATPTILATLLASASTTTVELLSATTAVSAATSNFYLKIVGVYSGYCNLVDSTSPVYIENLFPRNTQISTSGVALQHVFPNACTGLNISSGTTELVTISTGTPYGITGYQHARSPVIVGDVPPSLGSGSTQSIGVPLFTIHTISDGNASNADVKIQIDTDASGGTFDLTVRSFSDTNASQTILEKFPKMNMDPTSPAYVARMIGDSEDETGNFELISKYIYVVVSDTAPATALPYGFNSVYGPTGSTSGVKFPQWTMTSAYTTTTSVKRQALGLNYELTDFDMLMGGWGSQWDLTKTGTTIKGFHLNSGAYSGTYQTGPSASTLYDKTTAKFLVPLVGGFDGWAYNQMTRDLLDSTQTGSSALITAYETCLNTLRSTEDIDINLLAVPGVAITNAISTYAKELAEERADCFYIGDMPRKTSASAAALVTASIDSNYMGTYWPYVKFYDTDNTQDVILPPTAQALEAIAYTDQVAYPWFAPAGLNRGLLTDVSRAEYKLTQEDRETLYDNKINPIATFAGQGIAIWGQKTLQTRDTALNRINVRRMMLYVEKVIAGAALYLDFEQNDETTWDRFKAMVQPVLDIVKIKRGITDFRVIMDETTNTPDMIERGQMVGQIYIKPTKTAEIILINFNLMAQGATFEE